jgi:tubulin-specific chaperone D
VHRVATLEPVLGLVCNATILPALETCAAVTCVPALHCMCRVFRLTGVLSTLARFFKHGERALMLPLAPRLWTHIQPLVSCGATSTVPAGSASRSWTASSPLARQLCTKIAQRIALTLLDPTVTSAAVAATRAARRHGAGGAESACSADSEVLALTRGSAAVIPGVIDAVLVALRDSDTVVRWSAAKGLGRIAARLPARCAADVNDALLALFTPAEMDSAWQGACLALAEVVRHGLLPVERLSEVSNCSICSARCALYKSIFS